MDSKEILEKLTISALRILSIRPQSTWELQQKLKKSANSLNIPKAKQSEYIQEVLDTLTSKGHLDDATFAAWYRDQRLSFRPRSKRRLRVELSRKGLSADSISKALSTYDERLACAKIIDKKSALPREKLIAYLKREGFLWSTIQECIELGKADF